MATKQKRALITGINGQDGSYLTELLLEKGYEVFGIMRRLSVPNTENIHHLVDKIKIYDGDLLDGGSIIRAIKDCQPDEIYNLAAQSFVKSSWNQPVFTGEVTGLGALRVLEAIRNIKPDVKFYQASSSEMYGLAEEVPQQETTRFHPRSPYGVAKVFAHWTTVNYRESFDVYACSGILFNHESPRRGLEFVTRKIAYGAACISQGIKTSPAVNEEKEPIVKNNKIKLGNLDAKRDWGYAKDYCIDMDTSILTTGGFKYYHEIKENDTVLNYNRKNNRLEQDKVIKKIFLDNSKKMYVFSGRGVKLRCSANHRIYYQKKSKTSRGGWSDWKICEAQEFYQKLKNLKLRTKYDFRLPHTQDYKNPNLNIKMSWFKLIGYLVSEGCFCDTNRTVCISLSQSKTANREVYDDMLECLKNLKLEFKQKERTDGVVEFCFNAKSSREIIDYFDGFDIHKMPRWIFKAGNEQLELILESMMNGDGSWGAMTYFSRRKSLIHDFQTLATILGYRTTLHTRKSGMYECCLISKRKKHAYITECKKENSDEQVWCITTKNETIVTNKDGGIAVSGNCKAMWLMLQQDKPDDYVVATGENHSIKEFVEEAFGCAGITDWQKHIEIDKRFLRPAEVDVLLGDYSKAKKQLKWQPRTSFKELVKLMVESDIEKLKNK